MSSALSTRSLPALDPTTYARGHRRFESRSDQRAMITNWMNTRLDRRGGARELSVLSVGCGDGTVDAALAARACDRAPEGARRRWTGIDPHGPNTAAFAARLDELNRPALSVRAQACTFAGFDTDETFGPDEFGPEEFGPEEFDVVAFVHSLYYVDDLADTLGAALARLRPGGELLIAHAPMGALNTLTAALAPPVDGRHQPWSATVAAELVGLGASFTCAELDAVVDLTGCDDEDPALLDFTFQAHLDDPSRVGVLQALAGIAEPGPGLRVAHPVSIFTVEPTPA